MVGRVRWREDATANEEEAEEECRSTNASCRHTVSFNVSRPTYSTHVTS